MGNDNADKTMGHSAADTVRNSVDDARFDTVTIECYRRRHQILSGTYRAEWWMAIAVILVTAGIAFVVL